MNVKKVAMKFVKTGILDLSSIQSFNKTSSFSFKKSSYDSTFMSKKPHTYLSKQNEFSKRCKSVSTKQKLNSILSIMKIKESAKDSSPSSKKQMLNLVSDFHKSDGMRFKL